MPGEGTTVYLRPKKEEQVATDIFKVFHHRRNRIILYNFPELSSYCTALSGRSNDKRCESTGVNY